MDVQDSPYFPADRDAVLGLSFKYTWVSPYYAGDFEPYQELTQCRPNDPDRLKVWSCQYCGSTNPMENPDVPVADRYRCIRCNAPRHLRPTIRSDSSYWGVDPSPFRVESHLEDEEDRPMTYGERIEYLQGRIDTLKIEIFDTLFRSSIGRLLTWTSRLFRS